ncbi:MAG: tagaturonate epimerase family protein [Candidatus Omnitrophica bacterium]|nr:tagaturonate epimerase family protein [Candidatus Omnitrophota bacterium]
MQFDKLELNPVENPGVLDTATWNPAGAWQNLENLKYDWLGLRRAATAGNTLPASPQCRPYPGSLASRDQDVFLLVGLADGQQVFIELGNGGGDKALGQPLGRKRLGDGTALLAYPTDASVIDKYCRLIHPDKGPRALGDTPRLGIGTRMTVAVWPGIFDAMNRRNMAANTIQNSVRELNLLDNLRACLPPEKNYACGFGTIETGYTGSTYEGLWVAGVLAALQHGGPLRYGADADHIQVKRDPNGIARAKKLITAARYYSFYTIDMADILNYQALREDSRARAEAFFGEQMVDAQERQAVLECHRVPFRVAGRSYHLETAAIGRFVGKYWEALDVLAELVDHIQKLKQGTKFDLELTIDEHPPEIPAFDCLTTDEELLFVLREIQRRGLPVTHVAPNYGAEKGFDYRCPDGLEGLEYRARSQFNIAREFGAMLDFHSADDLTSAPRRVIQRATEGRHHFKISPMLQLLFAEVLQEFHPDLFQRWWDDAMAYARREAALGSSFAAECLRAYQQSPDQRPSRHHAVFHHYSFAFPGRRDDHGQFLYRQEFYRLSPAFYRAYEDRICTYLCGLADELF